jgi:Lrp/AsnC family transcriptional regulator, leucine-responsive regulatory protein
MDAIFKNLDRTGRQILRILQNEARLPFSRVGARVGLTGPAVAERVKRMEEEGIILGYHAEIAPDLAGFPIRAFIRLKTSPDRYPRVQTVLSAMPEVLECHHVTGEDAFIIRVAASSTEGLEKVIARMSSYGETSTAVVLSTALQRGLNWENEK